MMPVTLVEYMERMYSDAPILSRWQRLLCRLRVHRFHAAYHKYWERHAFNPIRAFGKPIPELMDMPWKKIDGESYAYKAQDWTDAR